MKKEEHKRKRKKCENEQGEEERERERETEKRRKSEPENIFSFFSRNFLSEYLSHFVETIFFHHKIVFHFVKKPDLKLHFSIRAPFSKEQTYDHNFLRFLPIFGEKIGVFLKNQ
jgi:hypothetical protein